MYIKKTNYHCLAIIACILPLFLSACSSARIHSSYVYSISQMKILFSYPEKEKYECPLRLSEEDAKFIYEKIKDVDQTTHGSMVSCKYSYHFIINNRSNWLFVDSDGLLIMQGVSSRNAAVIYNVLSKYTPNN